MLHLLQDDPHNPHKDSYGSPHPAQDSPYFKPGPHQHGAQDAYSPPPQELYKPHDDDVGGGYEAPPSHDDHDEGDGYTDFFDLGCNSVNLFGLHFKQDQLQVIRQIRKLCRRDLI